MSINKSYFSNVGLSLQPTTKVSEQTDHVRQGLTEHTAQSKTSHSKAQRNSTHIHYWLWKLKMRVHVQLWLDFIFQGSKFRPGTHTFPLVLYNVCDSPNCQSTRHFNMPSFLSRCKWFFNTRQSSIPTTQIHPFETGCMFSIGPHLSP